MKKFTIFTEEKPNIEHIVTPYFPSFTINKGTGHWNGEKEQSVQVVIISDKEKASDLVRAIAEEIKYWNDQQAVLVTEEELSNSYLA